jgi:dephospho-CoA kinase
MAFIVGITGGIGSGKSAVTDRLIARGITVVDADRVAREVVEPGTPALAQIVDHFGQDILTATGTLDRSQLRAIVFSDETQRKVLEGITHPAIQRAIGEQLEAAEGPYTVLSSPLLLEGQQRQWADWVVVVDVPEAAQLERTMIRDKNDEVLVRNIMAAQLPRHARLAQADQVIDNGGSIADLERAVNALHEDLLQRALNQKN